MNTARPITLNCDLGESAAALASGHDDALAARADIINIACGGHAGDLDSMRHFLKLAKSLGILAAAHPSYPDHKGFGRTKLAMSPSDLGASLREQLSSIACVADSIGFPVSCIKPHGALYHAVGTEPDIAEAFLGACRLTLPDASIMLQSGASTVSLFEGRGVPVLREAFADRRYEADGSLRDRCHPDALIEDPAEIGAHIRSLLAAIPFDTLCVHSDTPHALAVLAAARAAVLGMSAPPAKQ